MRKLSGRRHLLAIVIVFALVGFALVLPTIIKSVMPKKKEQVTEVTSLADIMLEQTKPKDEEMKEIVPPPPPLKSSIKFTAPVIKKDEEVSEEEEMKTQDELLQTDVTISSKDIVGTDEDEGILYADLEEIKEIVEESSVEKPFQLVEQMPEFPGGEEAMRAWLFKNIEYPPLATENGIQGRVFLTFVVGPDGKLSKVEVIRGADPSLDNEAIRVVKLMPAWTPGRQDGKAVYVKYNLPIRFQLSKEDTKPASSSSAVEGQTN